LGDSGKIEEVLEVGGARIALKRVLRAGGSRGAILLINGAIATMATTRWAEKGLREYDLIGFDFPNMGASGALNPGIGVLSKEQEARIVLEIVDRFRPIHLISVSWGGTALLLALMENPPGIESAVVASYSLGLSDRLVELSRRLVEISLAGDRIGASEMILDGLAAHLSPGMKRLYEAYFMSLDETQILYAIEQVRYVLEQRPDEHLESLSSLTVPMLFMNGELDLYTPPEAMRPIGAFVRNSTFNVVPGAGHFLATENRAAEAYVCRVLRGFLSGERHASSPAGSGGLAWPMDWSAPAASPDAR
jgi:rhamnosyltransferase subunit A